MSTYSGKRRENEHSKASLNLKTSCYVLEKLSQKPPKFTFHTVYVNCMLVALVMAR